MLLDTEALFEQGLKVFENSSPPPPPPPPPTPPGKEKSGGTMSLLQIPDITTSVARNQKDPPLPVQPPSCLHVQRRPLLGSYLAWQLSDTSRHLKPARRCLAAPGADKRGPAPSGSSGIMSWSELRKILRPCAVCPQFSCRFSPACCCDRPGSMGGDKR